MNRYSGPRSIPVTAKTGLRPIGLWLLIYLCFSGMLLGGLGCRRKPIAIVPMQKSAPEQLGFAMSFRERRNLPLIPPDQKTRFANEREVVRQHFVKVVDFFPGDRSAYGTPLAKLELTEMEAGLDSPRVNASNRSIEVVLGKLQDLMAEYPDLDFIQAKALYDQGLCHKRLLQFEDAKVCFQEVVKRFGKHADDHIKDIVSRSDFFYNQTEIKR